MFCRGIRESPLSISPRWSTRARVLLPLGPRKDQVDIKVVFGKGRGNELIPKDAKGHVPMWKKKSISWELPYSNVLEVRNAIDVMHLTKNLCVNLLGFMGVYRKSKDSLEARQDLQRMKERDNLHPEKTDDGRHYLSPASYTMSKEEKGGPLVPEGQHRLGNRGNRPFPTGANA